MHKHDDAIIGAELRRIRLEQGLTQAEVAEAIIVPQSFVSKTELGTRSIRAHELIYYAHALNMEVDKLMLRLRDAVYASPL